MTQQVFFSEQKPRYSIIPRAYQHEALENTFQLWEQGIPGTLTRVFTGGGKTIITCLLIDRWLQLGSDYHAMVISYEKQLVWQFAQEIEDVLRLTPGIEMEKEEINPERLPRIVVASRQTLAQHPLATDEQKTWLTENGIDDLGLITRRVAKSAISALKKGRDPQHIQELIQEWNADYRCNHNLNAVSRLHKFDYRKNWLVAYDEAHRHAHKLSTVGHIVDWFDQNDNNRRTGMTATPKRSDNVSIGSKMFPGVAIDYPLYTIDGACAVKDGYAVPYIQKFIQVESIDFKEIKELAGNSPEKWDAEINKRLETELATLCCPLLDMVENRQCLIFSPGVEMAKNVADFINARTKLSCLSCGKVQWHPKCAIEDGAYCQCGQELSEGMIVADGTQAKAVWGEVSPQSRRQVYEEHQSAQIQFLSVCGLCREGYNDPDIACIAIFRPVSRAASSLAEQMKGRGSRPLRGLIEGLDTAEERLQAIVDSKKPNCLIVDLVGVTGLADCATTIQIYAEGEEDEVIARAEELSTGGIEDPEEAIQQAREEIQAERERIRLEREERERKAREEAERRARAQAQVDYTVHERGYNQTAPGMASEKQLNYIRFLGMTFLGWEPSSRQAGRIITQLKAGDSPDDVAYKNGIKSDDWERSQASKKQLNYLRWQGISHDANCTPKEASELIDHHKKNQTSPAKQPFMNSISIEHLSEQIDQARSDEQLTKIAIQVRDLYRAGNMSEEQLNSLVNSGKERRKEIEFLYS